MDKGGAREFLVESKSNEVIAAKIMEIFSKYGGDCAREISKLAGESGFHFSQGELETAARASVQEGLGGVAALPEVLAHEQGPESACSRGCLSYSHNWHPDVQPLGYRPRHK